MGHTGASDRWVTPIVRFVQHPATSASGTAQEDTAQSKKAATPRHQAPASTSAPSPAEQVKRNYLDVSRLTASPESGSARIRVARISKLATSTSGPTIWAKLLSFYLRLRRFV